VTLLPGAEVYFTADLITRAREKRLMTYADGGRYLLLELPYQQIPMQVDETIFQLKLLGITPVMAHPERVAYYLENIERVAASVRIGALTQVTGASLTGKFGDKARDFARALLRRNLVHVLASDAHDVRYRPPILSEILPAAAADVGEAAARRMLEETPRAILDGRDVEVTIETQSPMPGRGLRARLRSLFSRRS